VARARTIEGLTPELSLREAARRTVEVRAAEVVEYRDGVLDTGDIKRVHDMRVATRRLRAALEAFRDAFPRDEFKPALRAVKDLADALGARRDPDVALASIEAVARKLPAPTRPGADAFASELRSDQARGNALLEAALANAEPFTLQPDRGDDVSFGEHVAAMLEQRRRRLRKRGQRAFKSGDSDDLHDTRIAAKRLRYLYEIAEPCFGEDAQRGAAVARGLQDVLGDLHDCDVMSERLRCRAAEVAVDDPRYLGFEALASYMDAKRRVLHRQFMQTWADIEL
jgi:CHAD domain-containing protein